MKKIKVFIVEDSILMQKIITDILAADPAIEVIGNTKLGKDALEKIPQLVPDVVTLDFNLPDIDGLTVLKKLMKSFPTKVLMISAHTQHDAEATIKSLEAGALDFLPKPSGEVSLDLYAFKDEIISKVKLIAGVEFDKKCSLTEEPAFAKEDLGVKKLVIIGASTGGPKAVIEVMSHVPADTDATFLIVQHMPKGFTKSFAERISWHSKIRAKEAESLDPLIKNAAYVAPSGYHMILERLPKGGYCVNLDDTGLVNYVRPAVDITLFSVAENFKGDIITVILTGMGRDGLEGIKKIKKQGAKVITQDEESCVVYGMPKAVAQEGLSDSVLPLKDIATKIIEYLNYGQN